jgi:hypothetical protein
MKKFLISILLACMGSSAFAVTGDLGTGVVGKIGYTNPTLGQTAISIQSWQGTPTVGFPSGCVYIKIDSATIGMDWFKIYENKVLVSKLTGVPIRFYAYGNRNCEADYIELP